MIVDCVEGTEERLIIVDGTRNNTGEDGVGLEYLRKIFLDSVSEGLDLVAVAGNLELLILFQKRDDGDVGEPLLSLGLVDDHDLKENIISYNLTLAWQPTISPT